MNQRYAEVIGDPIAQSKSPIIHRFWLEKSGLEGDYRRAHVVPEDLEAFLTGRRDDPDWLGCNVTIPHKQVVMPLLDRIAPLAARIGAVNTIIRQPDGSLLGENSDAAGFLEPLQPLLAGTHHFRMARVLGTGGAARAIAHALSDQGFTVVVAGRDLTKAQTLARELSPDERLAAPLSHFAEPIDFDWGERGAEVLDLIVNATSLGMSGQPPLTVDFSHVPPHAIVYDAVYAPLETPLLAEARARGHCVIDGLEMLVGQAAIAFRLLFGAEAPRQYDAQLRALLTA